MAVTKRKRKTNPWRAEVFVSGIRIASRQFETAAAAHAWHDQTKRRYQQGKGLMGEMTLADVIRRYREVEFPGKVGPTRRRREARFKFLEESPVAKVRMADFDGGKVELLLDWLVRHPRAATPTRRSFVEELKSLRVVLGFYRDCYDAQFVPPVTRWHRKRALFKGPLPRKPKDFYLPPEHARRWLAALARQRNPVFHGVALFQLVMGARVGEACAICDDAVDFERGIVTIKRTMEWVNEDGSKCRRIVDRTKTPESRRELPMPVEVARVLREAFARQPAVLYRSEGRLVRAAFHMASGAMLHDETVRGAYTKAFAEIGLTWTGSHICRDTNGTLALRSASLEAVRVNHGHASVVETEGYAKVHAMVENIVPTSVAALLFGSKGASTTPNHAQVAGLAEKVNDDG